MTTADAPLGRSDHVHISRVVARASERERQSSFRSVENGADGSVLVRADGPPDYVAIALDQVGYAWHYDRAEPRAVVVTGWSRSALTHRLARLEATARGLTVRDTTYAQQAIDYLDDRRTIDPTANEAIHHWHERVRDDLDARAGIFAAAHPDAGLPDDPRCAALTTRIREVEHHIHRLTWHIGQVVARAASAYERPGRRYADPETARTAIRDAVAAERHRDPAGAVCAALAALDQPDTPTSAGAPLTPDAPPSVAPHRATRRPGRTA